MKDKYMGQKLEKEDLDKVKLLMLKYKECHDEIKGLEQKMEEISNDMNFKLSDLNGLRDEERILYEKLAQTHGSGYLDTQNLEWINQNDENSIH
jgi:hypothetical protein